MENLLQGVGLFICIGGLALLVVAFFVVRAITGGFGSGGMNNPSGRPREPINRGDERPTYDDPDIDTAGGFGAVPPTGRGPDRDLDRGFGSSGDRLQDWNRGQGSRDRDRDDDDIQSRGGFGGPR